MSRKNSKNWRRGRSGHGVPCPYGHLFELQDYNFGIGAEAQWWAPSAGAAGREDLHFADAAEAVNELAINAASHPAPGNELADMGVAGELERNAGSLGNMRTVGSVG